jgi:hypothetical protein
MYVLSPPCCRLQLASRPLRLVSLLLLRLALPLLWLLRLQLLLLEPGAPQRWWDVGVV